ncbi:MAG: SGNH/GDSL hydrolase family protein [Thermoanaerobaculia bacterium]|nr:SGNH/GDSL hydrolase family protein [Thermoanaerobaculia bacterium]
MSRSSLFLLLCLYLPAAVAGADELLVATDRASGWSAVETEDGWSVRRDGTETARLPLPPRFEPYRLEGLAEGWVLTGTVIDDGRRALVVLRGSEATIELLPVPGEISARDRMNPVPLIEAGRLAALGWIEGDRQPELEVRVSEWMGTRWGPVESVSPSAKSPGARKTGEARTVRGAQLALSGTVLSSGQRLLVWSAFDGEDDEIVAAIRTASPGTRRTWSQPARVHPENRLPDVTPTVVGSGDTALVAWSAFRDGHYRLALALYDGRGWVELPSSRDRGATDPLAVRTGDEILVIYDSVVPRGIHTLGLDSEGRVLRREFVPSGTTDGRPPPAPAVSEATASEFRYLAFGDSITAGSFDELGLGGYPPRLESALACSPGVCSVDNQGKGGESTGQAVSRIDSVLAASPYDVMLLMEGTNDIFKSPPISNATIEFNLETIGSKAEEAGVETLLASIIRFHPDGKRGTTRDDEVQDLKNRLAQVAAERGYYFANPWAVLCPDRTCFDQHYFSDVPDPDPVGHPDASGYDILSGVFFDSVTAVPAPPAPAPVSPSGPHSAPPLTYTWNRESPQDATWYEVEIAGPAGTLFSDWYPVPEACAAGSCSTQLELDLDPATPYSWRVRGRNPAGRSAWSADESFDFASDACGGDYALVQDQTFGDGQVFACTGTVSVTAWGDVVVGSGAEVRFVAPRVVLSSGFRVSSGGLFEAGPGS